MTAVLTLAGVCLIIVQIIFAFFSGSFTVAVSSIITGVIFSIILFALSHIIETQQDIISRLDSLNNLVKDPPKEIICRKCGKVYTDDRTSCPYCGLKTPAEN